MFHGGTNFEYTNGANNSYGYEPQPTSYDYDAPLGEYGNPTPKYHAFREVIQKHLPAGETLPDVPELNPITTFATVTLNEHAPLSAAFGRRVQSKMPLTMEAVGMDFGYIHYETIIPKDVKGTMRLKDVRDYAVVIVDGKTLQSLDRRHRQDRLEVDLKKGQLLEILVENVGRVNYGPDLLFNLKGITESVTANGEMLTGWTVTPLPLYRSIAKGGEQQRSLTKAFIPCGNTADTAPTFYRGTFRLDKKGDVFLDTRGWCKGAVWIYGHSIGKYWAVGPQHTLYVPGPWVKKGKNEIVILDIEPTGHHSVQGLSAPVLDSIGVDKNQRSLVKREQTGTPILDEGDIICKGTMVQREGWQDYALPSPATMRHLCIEVTSSYDGQNACIAEINLIGQNGKPLDKSNWKVISVSSEEPIEGDAEQLFDDENSTYWHSQWMALRKPFPHTVIIDLGEIQTVTAVQMRQRGATSPGTVKDFTLYGRPQFFLFRNNAE